MFGQRKYGRALVPVLMVSTSLLLASCGGEDERKDEPRKVTGSSNTQGLWRMTEAFEGEVFYSTAIVQGTGDSVTMTDCSRAFEIDQMQRSGNNYTGYNHDLAPLRILNNDTMSWSFSNQARRFEKMDVDPKFDMGEFSLSSPLLPNVLSANLSCVQFSETAQGEVLVLATRVLGNSLVITINVKGGIQAGTYQVEPYGNEDAMVILSGSHWALTTLSAHDEVSSGTLTISSRGKVWITGEVQGVLRNGITPVRIRFDVETPVN